MLDVVVAVAARVVSARDGAVQPLDIVLVDTRDEELGRARHDLVHAEDLAQARRPVTVLGARVLDVVVFEDSELRAAHGFVEACLGTAQLFLDVFAFGHVAHRPEHETRALLAADVLETDLPAQLDPDQLAARQTHPVFDVERAAGFSAQRTLERCGRRDTVPFIYKRPGLVRGQHFDPGPAVQLEETGRPRHPRRGGSPLEDSYAPGLDRSLQRLVGALGSGHISTYSLSEFARHLSSSLSRRRGPEKSRCRPLWGRPVSKGRRKRRCARARVRIGGLGRAGASGHRHWRSAR